MQAVVLIVVAPARERGLKLSEPRTEKRLIRGRSREGAWIEMSGVPLITSSCKSRSREGAWIEIAKKQAALQRQKSLPRGSVD